MHSQDGIESHGPREILARVETIPGDFLGPLAFNTGY